MSESVERLLLLVALAVAVGLALDPLRAWRRRRLEDGHVRRLAAQPARRAGTEAAAPNALVRRLTAAGLSGPVEAYLLGVTLWASLVSWVLSLPFADLPAIPVAGFLLAAYVPWAALEAMASRRSRQFEQQLTGAIDLMTSVLQSGGTLLQALSTAARSSQAPLSTEFDEAARRIAVGMPLRRALRRMREQFDGEGVRLFVLTTAAKADAGGQLTPVLQALNETLRDRWRQQRQVRAQLAGSRFVTAVVVALPYLLAPMLNWMQPGWFDLLLNHPLGPTLLAIAVMFQMTGVLWMWRILSREL